MKKLVKNSMIGVGAGAVFASLALGGMAAQSVWRVYHANDPVGRNVVAIISSAPLETMLTRTNAVTGTIRFDPKNVLNAPKANFVVDATTLDTGISMRNEHMRSDKWLNTAQYPKISFTLTRVLSSGKTVLKPNEKVSGVVEGKLYFHGRTRLVKANLEVTATPQNAQTKERLPGDLLHVRAMFPVSLKEFGVAVPNMASAKIADRQEVTVDIFSSTGSPAPGSST
jgi:polyisoprenoid-binding protein YceI